MGPLTALTDAVAANSPLDHWLATGDVGALVGCYLGLLAVRVLLSECLDSWLPVSWLRRADTISYHVVGNPVTKPAQCLAARLPHLRSSNVYGRPLRTRSWPAYGELLLLVVCLVLLEEFLFFALPLVLSPTPTSAGLLLTATTTAWALGHDLPKGLALLVTTAWLKAIWWLTGFGTLAIAVHLGQNCVAMLGNTRFGTLTPTDAAEPAAPEH